MKEKIANLIDVRSIITILMVLALVVGWFLGRVTSEQFIPLVSIIITFYFAKEGNKDGAKAVIQQQKDEALEMENKKNK